MAALLSVKDKVLHLVFETRLFQNESGELKSSRECLHCRETVSLAEYFHQNYNVCNGWRIIRGQRSMRLQVGEISLRQLWPLRCP